MLHGFDLGLGCARPLRSGFDYEVASQSRMEFSRARAVEGEQTMPATRHHLTLAIARKTPQPTSASASDTSPLTHTPQSRRAAARRMIRIRTCPTAPTSSSCAECSCGGGGRPRRGARVGAANSSLAVLERPRTGIRLNSA